MEFLKKNYEKVLLSVVLVGLVVAVAFLPFKIASEKQKLEDMRNSLVNRPIKPLPPLDLGTAEAALKLMSTPPRVEFSSPNKLFNPLQWQKATDGHLIKVDATNIGPNALVVTKVVPLYLKLSLDSMTVSDSGSRYMIGIEKEAAATLNDRRKKQALCEINTKNETFTVRAVEAAPDNPTNAIVVLELNDTGEKVKIGKEQPFKRIDGYMIDLKYPPENKIFPSGRRVSNDLPFNGEEYKIVAISENELVLLAKSNSKKWTVKFTVTPGS